MKINFNKMPTEQPLNDAGVKPGINVLKIESVSETVFTSGAEGLTFVVKAGSLPIYKNVTLLTKDGEASAFGQYELRAIMEATNTIPTEETTTKVICALLTNKSFMGELVEETYNGKARLKLGNASTFTAIQETPNTEQETPVSPEVAKAVKAEPVNETAMEGTFDDGEI